VLIYGTYRSQNSGNSHKYLFYNALLSYFDWFVAQINPKLLFLT